MAEQKLVTVYGTGKGRMQAGKEYKISDVQSAKLVKQGFASYKKAKAAQS